MFMCWHKIKQKSLKILREVNMNPDINSESILSVFEKLSHNAAALFLNDSSYRSSNI